MEPRFRTAHAQAIQNRNTIIAGLRLQLHGHDKGRFGSKSKSSAQLALELILEELEIEQAAESGNEDEPSQAEATKPPRTSRKRKPFPKNLKRVQMTIPHSEVCADCGGSFKVLWTDLMEELEYVPGHSIVNQIGLALMAHILCSKYGYHLPLYRQS
jgi:transposase